MPFTQDVHAESLQKTGAECALAVSGLSSNANSIRCETTHTAKCCVKDSKVCKKERAAFLNDFDLSSCEPIGIGIRTQAFAR